MYLTKFRIGFLSSILSEAKKCRQDKKHAKYLKVGSRVCFTGIVECFSNTEHLLLQVSRR